MFGAEAPHFFFGGGEAHVFFCFFLCAAELGPSLADPPGGGGSDWLTCRDRVSV